MKTPLYGGIEAGGTKFVCAIGSGPDRLLAETRFPTTTPDETLGKALAFFQEQQTAHGRLQAVGVACFGPVDLKPGSPTWGFITATPKAGWTNTDVAGMLVNGLNLPVGFDTDVNGAALAEWRWGATQGMRTFVYLTIGTGVGGGCIAEGQRLHGLLHPEMGHMMIPHDREHDPFPGSCPFHGDCLEGLASGPALLKRWGVRAETLPQDHPAWDLEANYLALAVANLTLTLSPERVILGGGVMEQQALFPLIHRRVIEVLSGYVQSSRILNEIDRYIVPPGLGSRAGLLGALALAEAAHQSETGG